MANRPRPEIVDCRAYGLRYWRHVVQTDEVVTGHETCACGIVLGAWSGRYRLEFEPEDGGNAGDLL